MFAEILVAVDGSEYANRALEMARELATRYNARLRVMHAYPAVSDLLGYGEIERIVAERTRAGQAILDAALERLQGSGLDVRLELLEGPEAEAVLNVAHTRRCDLIVVGSRGRSRLEGLLVGSVAQKIIHHARCPVLVVR